MVYTGYTHREAHPPWYTRDTHTQGGIPTMVYPGYTPTQGGIPGLIHPVYTPREAITRVNTP